VSERWRYDGLYHLQQEEDGEVISKATIAEIFKQVSSLLNFFHFVHDDPAK